MYSLTKNKILKIFVLCSTFLLSFMCLFNVFNTKTDNVFADSADIEYIGYVYAINNWANDDCLINYINFETFDEFNFDASYKVYLYDDEINEIDYSFDLYYADEFTFYRLEVDKELRENLASFAFALVDEEDNFYYIQSFEDYAFEQGKLFVKNDVNNFFANYGVWILVGLMTIITIGISMYFIKK